METLTFAGILRNGPVLGMKNAVSLVGAVLLWVLTAWVPYLNVGTTIGLLGLVARMSRDEAISPTHIFDGVYRKQMGEFFLLVGFLAFGVLAGFSFLVIPGVAIATAWSLAPLLVIDQQMSPLDAISRSSELTSGHRLPLFFGRLVTVIGLELGVAALSALLGLVHPALGGLVALLGAVLVVSAALGVDAYAYQVLAPPRRTSQKPRASPPPAASTKVRTAAAPRARDVRATEPLRRERPPARDEGEDLERDEVTRPNPPPRSTRRT